MKRNRLYELRRDEMSKLLVACTKKLSGDWVILKKRQATKTGDTVGVWTLPKDHWERFKDKTNKEIIAAYPRLTPDKIAYKPFKGSKPDGSDFTLLKESRTPEQIWQTTSLDASTAIQKIFRKYGWTGSSRSFGKDGYSVYVPFSYREDDDFFRIRNAAGEKVALTTLPQNLQDELIVIQDFLSTKLKNGKFGSSFDKPHSRPTKYVSPAERVKPYQDGRKKFAQIVPAEFFKDWRISVEHDYDRSSDSDEGVTTYNFTDEVSVCFESRSNKEVWAYFGSTIEAEGRANYRFYPGRMYMSNGDPGYPDEWDEDDVEFYDFIGDSTPELSDQGEDTGLDTIEALKGYMQTYVDNYETDIEKYPEDYFYD